MLSAISPQHNMNIQPMEPHNITLFPPIFKLTPQLFITKQQQQHACCFISPSCAHNTAFIGINTHP